MSGLITDSIGNFLTKIRNASRGRKEQVADSYSKMKESIAKLLARKEFIQGYEVYREGKFPILVITLKTSRGSLNLKRISKPGLRIYIPFKKIHRIKSGLGMAIVSTSRGIMTDGEAKKAKLGGEYICEVS